MAGTGITPEVFDAREKLLIDQTVAAHRGRPGALAEKGFAVHEMAKESGKIGRLAAQRARV